MKATELMLNDLITYRGEIYYVAGTDRLGGLVDIDNEDDIELIHESEIEPIPLTAEILEKNGWVHDTEYHNWWHEGVEFVIFCNEDNPHCYYVNSISSIHLDYIHSLQHILRLCGLDELADNFKIE